MSQDEFSHYDGRYTEPATIHRSFGCLSQSYTEPNLTSLDISSATARIGWTRKVCNHGKGLEPS
jgi:hypothetical protein